MDRLGRLAPQPAVRQKATGHISDRLQRLPIIDLLGFLAVLLILFLRN